MSSLEQRFFDQVAARRVVRPSVRAVVLSSDGERLLVQRPSDSPGSNYAFIGGEYEIGDTFDSRIRTEVEEETNARVTGWHYLFVVENRFMAGEHKIHGLEHYLRVSIDREDVVSEELHLVQEWLPIQDLATRELRPTVVRDLVASGDLTSTDHLIVDGWTE